MPTGTFNANLTPTPPLSVEQFYRAGQAPPGSIGVCLSGGGSRALTAGMGQLQALSYLTYSGSSLLSQVKAVSTVSGGSWLGVPFEFLPAGGPADSAFLGTYNNSIGSATLTQLGQLSAENAAFPITAPIFAPVLLAVQAVVLYEVLDVPPDMIWQTIVGLNILMPPGLYVPGSELAPTDFFSDDSQTLSAITSSNSSLSSETAYLIASGNSRTPRPYLVCNMAMLINEAGTQLLSLAPVQATPFMTGVVGSPTGTDANGQTPGGGGVTSFAFNSSLSSVSGSGVTVTQSRQWSLTDIAGASSAFFAALLQNQITAWKQDPLEFAKVLFEYFEEILKWIESHLTGDMQVRAAEFVRRNTTLSATDAASISLPDPEVLIPEYDYWPVANPKVVTNPQDTGFADGGSLENTGINALLAYSDITALIAFVNSEQPLVQGSYGISDGQGGFIPNTNIIVDDAIPPLFGYQPYGTGEQEVGYKPPFGTGQPTNFSNQGYVPYAGASYCNLEALGYANNQVFNSSDFPALLQGLWAAANNGGSNASPAIFTQTIEVLANGWFGIASRNTITIVWCYLNIIQPWIQQFANNPTVASYIQNDIKVYGFPNYQTVNTNLTATQVNLMSNLAAYSVVQEDAANKTFTNLFQQFGISSSQQAKFKARASGQSGK